MLPPAVLLFYLIITNKSNLDRIFDKEILKRIKFDDDTLGRVGRNMMVAVSALLMIIALARPVKELRDLNVTQERVDLLLALDISRSMEAKDIYPNRLTFAKRKMMELIERFDEAKFAVVAFGREAFLLSPLTADKEMLRFFIKRSIVDPTAQKGTDFLKPLALAPKLLKGVKERIVVIFSDGGDQKSFQREIALAKELKESVFIYLAATQKGAPLFDKEGNILKNGNTVVISRQNSAIKALAIQSGGDAVEYSLSQKSVDELIGKIKQKVKFHKESEGVEKEYKEYFYYPLALAILFMLFAFSSLPRRDGGVAVTLFLLLSTSALELRAFDFFDIMKAKSAYENAEYQKALQLYQKLAASNRSQSALYNLASTYYKLKQYKKALYTYKKIVSKDDKLRFKLHFNQGNCYFKMGEYLSAIKEYEAALKIKSDEDAKYNLELAKKRLKEQKQKQKQQEPKRSNSRTNKQKNKKRDSKQQSSYKDKTKKQLTPKELRVWKEHLKKLKIKIKPLKLETTTKERERYEKPW